MDARKALNLIKDNGIFGLFSYDGCLCTHCSIQGVDIQIYCRKSSRIKLPFDEDFRGTVIRVSSSSIYHRLSELQPIADEVSRQIYDLESTKILVRLCDERFDKDCTCVHCGKPREDIKGYFCNEHIESSLYKQLKE